jgi:protein-L-isoaspartate O-methyltransferase
VSQARQGIDAKRVRKELLEGQSPELLQALHLLTREGHLNADARRKLKQINHLVGLLTPALDDVLSRFGQPLVCDMGSGNAYLSFILYELFFKPVSNGTLLSVEWRAELMAKATARAQALGYQRMQFITGSIEQGPYPERLHLVTALHACDTATDDALVVAIEKNADHVAVVPCCQAEAAQLLHSNKTKAAPTVLPLFEHPWHRREFGSHLTNVMRALVLESFGYQVTVTELAGWEHSLKNELILGRRHQRENKPAQVRLRALVEATQVRPKVVRHFERQLGLM